jgi:signal transduction histidine kinase
MSAPPAKVLRADRNVCATERRNVLKDVPIRVLMVDDDEDDFVLVRATLRDVAGTNYTLDWESEYEQGLLRACENHHDVVLVDYRLGKRDGIAFVKEMVCRRCVAPVILLTGQGDREIDLAATEAGAADFISKTNLNADILERAIRYSVAQTRAEEQRLKLLAERAKRAELEAAAKAKDEFLAMLSHELRTPLTPVLMTISAWQTDASVSAVMKDDLANIRRNVELEVKLIDDLLDLTRVARGKLELHEEAVEIHGLLKHAYETCVFNDAKTASIKMQWRLNAYLPFVWGDPARLEQIFWNLLKNAVKFTPKDGTITVETRNVDGSVQISVSDTGVGIDPKMLPKIFDAFEQGGRDVTKKFGGLGLGLAICRAVAELHGGKISAQSDGPEKGATFMVTLPILSPEQAASDDGRPSRQGAGDTERSPLRLLLVEDSPATLKIISRLFKNVGYQVTGAQDLATARTVVQQAKFDLVISDLGLPDGSGLELMRELRDRFGLRGIALSGYGMEEDVRESLAAGFVEHLVKPVDFARLEAAVRRAGAKTQKAGA